MIKARTGVAGRYRFTKCKADAEGNPIEGTREVCADWFDNLILDQGLNFLGTRGPRYQMASFKVGAGSTAPAVTDTSMESLIASTITLVTDEQGMAQDGSLNWYTYRRITRRFGAGVAEGNLSEVGTGDGSAASDVFSRALILDSGGSPTTITVLADEILDVTYELRIFPPTQDFTGTISLGGVVYDYTARACNVNSNTPSTGWNVHHDSANVPDNPLVYDGNIGSITSEPSGASDNPSTETAVTYVNGSYEATGTGTWALGDGNLVGGIRSLRIRVGWGTWQVEFSNQSDQSTIPKDNTQELILGVTHSWARV